jgi:hypothetical protein
MRDPRRERTCRPVTALVVLASLVAPNAVGAWPAPVSQVIARDARRLLPRGLAAAMARREEQVRSEMGQLPEALTRAIAIDLVSGRIEAETIALAQQPMAEALTLFKKRHVGEGLVRMGGLARVPIDLSDPALAGEEALPARVREEYYLFVQANLSKMPLVLTDSRALELVRGDLGGYWQRLLDESRAGTAILRAEMLRDGRVVDHRTIDYRSPVFAVASLAYSRAVTAAAGTWLAVWREARGDLTLRPRLIEVIPGAPPAARPMGPAAAPRPNSEVK